MNRFSSKVDLAASCLVIVAAVMLIALVTHRFFFSEATTPTGRGAMSKPVVGERVMLADVDFSQSEKTVVLVLDTSCKYCDASIPFYQRMVKDSLGESVKFIAVFPTPIAESKAYLFQKSLENMDVRQSDIRLLNTRGTPTLILANSAGEVLGAWVGQLSSDKEDEVMKEINL